MTLALVSRFSTPTLADPARTTDGHRVDTDDYVVMTWSVTDAGSVARLKQLSGFDGVLAVNTDSASQTSQVIHLMKAEEIDLPVVCDPAGRLATNDFASEAQLAQLIEDAAVVTVALNE
ncbi:MAG: hypothetical protein GY913_35760 [Proteobacteria bacterium]|nr:hypothetical protein [Pseudomonadota bacterium]MCP4922289.1 hypothetical protein [Pseudomonadota bacterium]